MDTEGRRKSENILDTDRNLYDRLRQYLEAMSKKKKTLEQIQEENRQQSEDWTRKRAAERWYRSTTGVNPSSSFFDELFAHEHVPSGEPGIAAALNLMMRNNPEVMAHVPASVIMDEGDTVGMADLGQGLMTSEENRIWANNGPIRRKNFNLSPLERIALLRKLVTEKKANIEEF